MLNDVTPPDFSSLVGIQTAARAVLKGNDQGNYTVPTASGLYPAQWNWDLCLVALGFAQYDVDRAWTELETLFSGQWPDGMVPSILFHQDDESYFPNSEIWKAGFAIRSSGITQPPVAAICLRYLYERTPDASRRRLAPLVPKVAHYHHWIRSLRDPEGTGLAAIVHPWESGMDNSPIWDAPLSRVPSRGPVASMRRDAGFVATASRPKDSDYERYIALVLGFRDEGYDPVAIWRSSPFLVADVGFNAIFARAEKDLAFLLAQSDDAAGAQECTASYERVVQGLERCWSEADGYYYSRDLRAGDAIAKAGVSSLLPLFANGDVAGRHPRLLSQIESWLERVKYGIPSYRPGAPEFDAECYWRGPVWLVVNWMLIDGLLQNGRADLAERVRSDSLELVARGGFAEYFDPMSGDPLGGRDFSWTAAMVLLLQSL